MSVRATSRRLIVSALVVLGVVGCSSRNADSKARRERDLILAIQLGPDWEERGWGKSEDELGFATFRVFSSSREDAWSRLLDSIRSVQEGSGHGVFVFKLDIDSGQNNDFRVRSGGCSLSMFTTPSPAGNSSYPTKFPVVPLEKARVSIGARCPRNS
jgi:hypothetical protein